MNTHQAATPFDIRMMQRVTTWLWMLLAVLVVAIALSLFMRAPYFTLQAIVVEGDTSHHNRLTLRANVAPRLSGNFFSINLQATRSVFESLPWVRHAVVKREFPNKLRVVLQEHKAVGLWGNENEFQLLNTHGEVFEANPGDTEADSLPHFVGSTEQAGTLLQAYRQLSELLEPHSLTIEQLTLSGRASWQATLNSGTVIEFGRAELPELLKRTQVFLATATQATEPWGKRVQHDIESVDLRHHNGYAIKLRGIGTIQAKPGTSS